MTVEEDSLEKIRQLESKVVELQLAALQKSADDHEHRLRTMEETASALHPLPTVADDHERRLRLVEKTVTRFNLLISLTLGGGLLSLVNLVNTLYALKR